jgi:ornithine carbamoyltransferase
VQGRRHLISLRDLADAALFQLVELGVRFGAHGIPSDALRGCVVGTLFTATSTRTRTAFGAAALRLGAGLITYGPRDLQLQTGESEEDTGRVLGEMLDALVVRTAADPEPVRALAGQGSMAVINAMTADEHPTQALADLSTLFGRFGSIDGLRVLYVGEGNNTAAALALALGRYRGASLTLCCPAGYEVDAALLASARRSAEEHAAEIVAVDDLTDVDGKCDVVYTTRWQTTGTTKADPRWRDQFVPFRVDGKLLAAHPGAVFMHDLPAHRGEEVTGEVIDGPASIAFEQARMKMYSAAAVLCSTMGGP